MSLTISASKIHPGRETVNIWLQFCQCNKCHLHPSPWQMAQIPLTLIGTIFHSMSRCKLDTITNQLTLPPVGLLPLTSLAAVLNLLPLGHEAEINEISAFKLGHVFQCCLFGFFFLMATSGQIHTVAQKWNNQLSVYTLRCSQM